MPSTSAIRQEIESSLAVRIPGALSVRFHQTPDMVATGIVELDGLLSGGLPLGELTEIVGPACSGKTTLVSSLLAGVTRQGAACAYVDVADAFDPLSAAALGIDLSRLLWVRAGQPFERFAERTRESWARLDQALRATCSGCRRRTGAACAFSVVVSLSAASGEVAGAFPAADTDSVRQELCFGGVALRRCDGTLGMRGREGLAAFDRI
jgi:energy-coupling factor transporter ATP-binding protein EcfA2